MSGVVEKIKDKVQQATHSGPYAKEGDAAHTGAAGTHTTGTHTTGTHTTGTHHTGTGIGSTGTHTTGTGIGSTGTHTTGTGTGSTSTNAGPHDSNLANKLDPRVDSDRDGSRTAGNTGAGLTGTTGTHTGTGLTGSHHTSGTGLTGSHTTGTHTGTGLTGTTGTHTSTAGPHNTNIANKLDPRVDSDRDGSNTLGGTTGTGYGSSTTGAGYGSTAGTGLGSHSGLGSTGAGYGSATGPATGTAGPHSSNLLNKADPRVDSDLDGSRNAGAAGGVGGAGYGTTGTHSSGFGTTGTHNTGVGHSGVGGTTGSSLTGSHSGPGPAPNTAGPHSSDMLNKVDPRVDSDLDGSKTVGGNATYQHDHPATDTSNSSFTKSIDAAFRNDSVQKPTYSYQQVDGAVDDSSRASTPPDAAKHTPEKFKEKQLRFGNITQKDLDDNEEYRREHLAGNEFKEALEKYGSGAK